MTRPPEKPVPVSERDRADAKEALTARFSGVSLLTAQAFTVEGVGTVNIQEQVAIALARARHEGRLEGLEEAAVYADEHPGCAATECDAADRIARAIRALALPEGDAHE